MVEETIKLKLPNGPNNKKNKKSKKSNKNTNRRGKGRGGGNGGSRGGAFVSSSLSISPKNSGRVSLFGTDRLFHVPDISGFKSGDPVVDFSVSAESFKRMSHMAEAYQRVRFKKLVFRVVTMCPTSVTGGFAAAFVADPTDVLGGGPDALDRVVAQTGSKITKLWESATIHAKLSGDLLYTSVPPLGDQRLSSPGRMWVVIESQATQKVPLTIYCDWAVDFFVPSLEGKTAGGGVLVVQTSFYTRASNVGLWWKDSSGGDDPRTQIPGIEFDKTYQSKQKFYLSYNKAGNFDKFKLVNDPAHGVTFAPVAPDGKVVIEVTTQNQWVFEKGDVLTPLPENDQVGSEYLCQRGRSGPLLGFSNPISTKSFKQTSASLKNSKVEMSELSRLLKDCLDDSSRLELIQQVSRESQMASQSRLSESSRSPSFEVLS